MRRQSKKVCIYIRSSSNSTLDFLIQRNAVIAHCMDRGYSISPAGIYADQGRAGRNVRAEMLQALRAGRYDVLVVHDVTRVARSIADIYELLSALKEGGASIEAANMPEADDLATGLALLCQLMEQDIREERARLAGPG